LNYGELLLSKIIDNNDVAALTRFGINESDFLTEGERKAYRFIVDYAEQHGRAPSYATVEGECEGFTYIPAVEDSYEFLARQIKSNAAKQAIIELFNGQPGKEPLATKKFEELDGQSYLDWLISEIESVKIRTDVRKSIGRTLTDIKLAVKEEYLKREEGKSFKCWKTPFDSLTNEIGGWYSGDVYGIMGESGRGKSYLICKIVDSLLRQGANVLVKSFELKEYVWISRLISIATATDGLDYNEEIGEKIGIPVKAILSGKLEDYVRSNFLYVVDNLDQYYPGKLYFQGKSGKELTRTLDDLERELSTVKLDAVVIDPFYGLADVYGRNANKTAGGAAEQAATRFENIIGDHDVVGFYTVQATVDKPKTDDDGNREIQIPTRDQVKTSKRLLDIATNLIGFDSVEKEGIAALGISKGRNGGEDFRLDLMALFDYGVLKEFPPGELEVQKFTSQF
jgi:replicative DNA helicase